MTWSYTNAPNTSNRDAVRFLVGDNDFDNKKVTDEEITFALAEEGGIHLASSLIAKGLAARFATLVDRSIGDLRISYSQRQKHFTDLAKELKARGDASGGRVYAGGISVSDKKTVKSDTDRVKPAFAKGMHDNLGQRNPDDQLPGFDSL